MEKSTDSEKSLFFFEKIKGLFKETRSRSTLGDPFNIFINHILNRYDVLTLKKDILYNLIHFEPHTDELDRKFY